MCGFAGIIHGPGHHAGGALRETVELMADTVRHRGPDDAGVWIDERAGIGLGFRRLAIIDISQAGHQPFLSGDNRFALVFNGEIYNHAELRAAVSQADSCRWKGHSDTETLLACFAAWGVRETLERAVGMFALALWDGAERKLYLARDRFGEKPLYYGWTRGAFVFGSELKALRGYPGFDNTVDPGVLALYLQYCCVPAPYAIYRDIYKLEPGCILTLSVGDGLPAAPNEPLFAPARQDRLWVERYWSLPDAAVRGLSNQLTDEEEATDLLAAALGDAIRLQSIADVPLGAFLSGGIDSSLIVALMQAQSARPIKTFTIGFEEAAFNEAEYAKTVAAHLGTDHTELYVSARQALDVIPRLPELYSEPFADSSQIPTHLVSHVARHHVTVALSGDGGDELFGGYTRYLWGPRMWNQLRRIPMPVRRALSAGIEALPPAAWDTLAGAVPRLPVARVGEKAHKLAYRLRAVGDVDDLYRMLVTTWPPDADVVLHSRPLPTRFDGGIGAADSEQSMMLWDALTYLPDDILHKVDRASMGVGLETRAPYLDHRVAELAWRLPLHMKIRGGTTKWILRQLLDRYVPSSLVERPKMGFSMPVDQWLRGPLREWAESLLSWQRLQNDGYFDPAPIRQKWSEHLSGARNWHSELWCVLMFQAWLENGA